MLGSGGRNASCKAPAATVRHEHKCFLAHDLVWVEQLGFIGKRNWRHDVAEAQASEARGASPGS